MPFRTIQVGLVVVSLCCFGFAFYLRFNVPTTHAAGSVVLGPPGAKPLAWPAATFDFSVKPADISVNQVAEAVLKITITTMHGATFVGEPVVQLHALGFDHDSPQTVSLSPNVPAVWKWQLQPTAAGDRLVAANLLQTVMNGKGRKWKCDLGVYPPTISVLVREASAFTLQNVSIAVGILAALGNFAGPIIQGLSGRRTRSQPTREPAPSRKRSTPAQSPPG